MDDPEPNGTDLLVGWNITIHRIRRGMSQTKLARTIGMPTRILRDCETGKTAITVSNLFDISRALRVPVEEFLYARNRGDIASTFAPTAGHQMTRIKSAFSAIADPTMRQAFLVLAESFVDAQEKSDDAKKFISTKPTACTKPKA